MGIFEKIFGTYHHRTYHIELYALDKEFINKNDVFITISKTCIYHVVEGYIEISEDYVKQCPTITKYQYDKLIAGEEIRNLHYKPV